MSKNLIFLDVNGVLNTIETQNNVPFKDKSYNQFKGVEDKFLKNLKSILLNTKDASIILSSSYWRKQNYSNSNCLYDYLVNRLLEFDIKIDGQTKYIYTFHRGVEIIEYLSSHEYDSYIILDDEIFDFKLCGISDRLVKTDFYGENAGLTNKKANAACDLFNKQLSKIIDKKYYEEIDKIKGDFINKGFKHNGLIL